MIMAFCMIVVRVSMWINVNVPARHSLDFAVAVADNLQTQTQSKCESASNRDSEHLCLANAAYAQQIVFQVI